MAQTIKAALPVVPADRYIVKSQRNPVTVAGNVIVRRVVACCAATIAVKLLLINSLLTGLLACLCGIARLCVLLDILEIYFSENSLPLLR